MSGISPLNVGEANKLIRDTIKVWDNATRAFIPWRIPTGAVARFYMSHRLGRRTPVDALATIDPNQDTTGKGGLTYNLAAADLAKPGIYDPAWKITQADGTIEIIPFRDPIEVKR